MQVNIFYSKHFRAKILLNFKTNVQFKIIVPTNVQHLSIYFIVEWFIAHIQSLYRLLKRVVYTETASCHSIR